MRTLAILLPLAALAASAVRGPEALAATTGLLTTPLWTADGPVANAGLGHSVATAGDVNGDGYSDVIVTAPPVDSVKHVYVFHGSANGLPAQASWSVGIFSLSTGSFIGPLPYYIQTAAAAGDVNGDGFDDVIVGSRFVSETESGEGQVLVYHGSATGLDSVPAWTYEGAQVNEHLGNAVATAGDVNGDGYADVVVGALDYDGGQTNEGRVLVFHGSAGGLGATPAWTQESDQVSALFGSSVSTAGDVNGDGFSDVVIGATKYDGEGAAFLYMGSAGGLVSTAAWSVTGGQAGANFGRSVSTAGDVNGDGFADVIVGSLSHTSGQTNEGAAFVYHGGPVGLGAAPTSTFQTNQISAGLSAVATAGDMNGDGYGDVIVGIYRYDASGVNVGRVGLLLGSPSGLPTTLAAWIDGDQTESEFGYSVATAGDVNGDGFSDVIAGAPKHDGANADQGRAYVYAGCAMGPTTQPDWTAELSQAVAWFGYGVAGAGDVNGDGFSDVIVGARRYDAGELNEGGAFLHLGSAAGLGPTAVWTAEGNQQYAFFGSSVASAGDVNGDGYDDVIVRASDYDNGEEDEGRAFVYHGSPAGLEASPAWTAEGNQATAYFSHAIASAGDVNGDGFADVIVGANHYDGAHVNEGRAYLYLGSAGGLAADPAWTMDGGQADARFGSAVAGAGDVNGDGYADVIIGADAFDAGEEDEGAAFLYLGSPSGLQSVPAWTAEGNQVGACFGDAVASAMDVNGDGFSDVIIGARNQDEEYTNGGKAYVYHGSPTGLGAVAAWTAQGSGPGALFGYSVASAGDVNGDGYSDVIVGSPSYGGSYVNGGEAHLYLGSPSGLTSPAAWNVVADQARVFLGLSVASTGDVNGDGFSDVVVGAPEYSNGEPNEGVAFLYLGGDGGGRQRLVQQRRSDGSAPIALGSMSDSPASFLLSGLGLSPMGRANLRLEAEVKPLGTPFDGTGLTSGAVLNSGLAGVNLEQFVAGLDPDTPYHWRARIASDSPFHPHTPWVSPPGNGENESDLRTAPAAVSVDGPVAHAPMQLAPAAPNPFQSVTQLAFTLPEAGRVRLAVYDLAGREVALLAEGERAAGRQVARWTGRDRFGRRAPAGVYFARLEAAGQSVTRRVVLTR